MGAKFLKVAAGLAVSAAALYFLLTGVQADGLLQAASRVSAGGLLAALAFLALGYGLRVVRWWWMLRSFAPAVRLADCVTPFVGSIALNNVLPLRAGDAVRALAFQRQLGLPASTVLGTVVVERLLDLAMLLALFFAGLALVPAGVMPDGVARGAAVLAVSAVLGLLALPLLGPWLARKLRRGSASAAGLRGAAASMLDSFSLLRSGRRALALLPLTVLVWLCEGAVFAAIAADIAGAAPLAAAGFAMASGTLSTMLPSTPGYVGTFDYFTMLGLHAFGAPREVATAFAIAVHAVLWLPLTAAGLALLALHGGVAALRPSRSNATQGATAH